MGFSKDFVWGAATASYQVEGAAYEDGKGLNIWDVFCKTPGKVYEGHTGDVSCDQYHHYQEDVAMMKEMGVKAYRFSLSWARIIPDGTGTVNEKGIAYYDHLIDELLANGIEPYITLYHWDLPYELHKRGGWLNPEMPEWFAAYAKLVAERFSDRVKYFFTINEPQCVAGLGYLTGEHAPGLKMGPYEYFEIWHNILKSHGRAVQELRAAARQPIKVGAASCGAVYFPYKDTQADIEAARQVIFGLPGDSLEAVPWSIAMWGDPIVFGKYPESITRIFGNYMQKMTEEDSRLIAQPLDFFGFNIYNGVPIEADENGKPVRAKRSPGFARTAMQQIWPMSPKCMYWATKYLYERYHLPIYITENGMSDDDWISLDGQVHDSSRVDFIHRYLLELKRSAEEGNEILGYFAWSAIDNFEWARGYSERFGMVYVDFESQKRTMKDSAFFYKVVAESNGEIL